MASSEDSSELSPGVHRRPHRVELQPNLRREPPSPEELIEARKTVVAHDITTPTYRSASLSDRHGRDIRVKYEIFTPIRSFKVRGPLWAVSQAKRARASAIVTASTGNHGQGVAYAGAEVGVPVTVFVPEDVDPVKFQQMDALGAQIERFGSSLADAERGAQAFAAQQDAVYLEDGEDPHLMAGAASLGFELLEQMPDVDTILAPVGGGNLAAALALAIDHVGSPTKLIGVQSTAAPGATTSWLSGTMDRRPSRTRAGGLATDRPGHLALTVLHEHLAAMCLVEELDLWPGVRETFEAIGYAVELAAAAPIVALERFGHEIPGDTVALIASGACIDTAELITALSTDATLR